MKLLLVPMLLISNQLLAKSLSTQDLESSVTYGQKISSSDKTLFIDPKIELNGSQYYLVDSKETQDNFCKLVGSRYSLAASSVYPMRVKSYLSRKIEQQRSHSTYDIDASQISYNLSVPYYENSSETIKVSKVIVCKPRV